MPRSLFLKIFIWFGAVLVTVVFGTFLVGELMRRHDREELPMRRPFDQLLDDYANDAANEYERGGQPALLAYLNNAQNESHVSVFFFNSQLQELTGREGPPNAPELARRVLETQEPQFAHDEPPPLIARPATSSTGGRYVLVAEPPHRSPALFHPTMHLLAIVLTGGLFCYWLAWYLTSPVAKLRAATRELAKGNLSARVAPTLGRRRDELASLAADFDVMAEKIQTLVASQRRLLGDISHELRSPLARLNVALELARQRSGAEAVSALERIQREAETLNEMIGQLLALTRLESGAEEISKTEFDLSQLLQEIVTDADFEAQARNRSVKLGKSTTAIVNGVPSLLRRAIENVVRNAVHHTAEGTEVEVELLAAVGTRQGVSRQLTNTSAETHEKTVSVIVRDHGPGVPAEALAEIFRPFYRVDEARDREAGGVGLGLAIAERAIKLHGGTIKAANAEDGGLIVTISLPNER